MKEMIMPQNYVELEQEEMMYLEGGGLGWNGVDFWFPGVTIFFHRDTLRMLAGIGVTNAGVWVGRTARFAGPAGYAIASALFVAGVIANNITSGFAVSMYSFGQVAGWSKL
jgi:hypothetical protein